MSPHVSFLGKQNHVERIIPLAHALLMPSEMESFGLAAAPGDGTCGLAPDRDARLGGVPEVIMDGETGFMEEVGDIEAQAERAVQLLTDDVLLERIALAGRKRAKDHFGSTRLIMPATNESYYREVLER